MEDWFEEKFELEKGRTITIKIKDKLFENKSKFQFIEVYDTVPFGKMLVTDGIIMLTQFDNYAYHEMITHVPITIHGSPKKILIVGGGDGGTLTEVLKYPFVESVTLCEIDPYIIQASRSYFPEFNECWKDQRLSLVFEDANEYVKKKLDNCFDVIIVDSSDPIGMAEVLFEKEFYDNVYRILNPYGVMSAQMESIYYHKDFIQSKVNLCNTIFDKALYYYTLIPTYPSGTIGFIAGFKNYTGITPNIEVTPKEIKYYTKDIHESSFILPKFAESLNSKRYTL